MTHADHDADTHAVYEASADTYLQAIGAAISSATEGPIDRAVLASFVELVRAQRNNVVADVGCGPGRVAGFMADAGLDVVGVDQSRAMLTLARAAYPRIGFVEGRLGALPIAEASIGGVASWYSIIHTPPQRLDKAFLDFGRVLVPGGFLLVAFQAGTGERVRREDAYGTNITLTSYRHAPEDVAHKLLEAGLSVHTQVLRGAELAHEATGQALIIARFRDLARPRRPKRKTPPARR